ncbi:MAG: hypothetical protein ACE14M_00680 [Terriglobales bacterium]
MMLRFCWVALALTLLTLNASAQTARRKKAADPGAATKAALSTVSIPDISVLERMSARFDPTLLRVDTSMLTAGDRQALVKLIEAARVLDDIYMEQLWSGDRAFYQRLQQDKSALGKARTHYFWINKGPWSDLDDYKAFLPDVPPRKPLGANFYPEGMTKPEFEAWVKTLSPLQRAQAESYFTIIRRTQVSSASSGKGASSFSIVPYSEAYRPYLERAAGLLREAAALTPNASLKRFLSLRADALLSNDYYESELAWMDLDAPLEVTFGPYETYTDELLGYKAAFEAYINLRDERETAKLAAFARYLQEIENNLPIEPQYRNPKLGPAAPIRVVNEIFASGDAAHGVATAAYNLPNDERVVQEKGSKRIMLKNVQAAKFRTTLVPIATRVLAPRDRADLSFDMFFTHILAHELMHGLGPHQITVAGQPTTVRQQLKDLYSAIEEAKADATGLFALQYMMDHAREMKLDNVLYSDEAAQRQLYITYLASAFRTLRFGLNDAHGKGMALQFNYLMDKGAFVAHPDGTFSVNPAKIRTAVRHLTHDLLTIEATGDYAGAKKMLDTLGVLRPPAKNALEKLQGIPTDIEPIFITADRLSGRLPAVEQDTAPRKVVKKKKRVRRKR